MNNNSNNIDDARMNVCATDEIVSFEIMDKNRERYGYDGDINGRRYETCICCGKPIFEGSEHRMIHLSGNGDISDYEHDYPKNCQSWDQGFWPIGNGCYRKFRKLAHNVSVKHYIEHPFDGNERFEK